jgi:hypothetical protein
MRKTVEPDPVKGAVPEPTEVVREAAWQIVDLLEYGPATWEQIKADLGRSGPTMRRAARVLRVADVVAFDRKAGLWFRVEDVELPASLLPRHALVEARQQERDFLVDGFALDPNTQDPVRTAAQMYRLVREQAQSLAKLFGPMASTRIRQIAVGTFAFVEFEGRVVWADEDRKPSGAATRGEVVSRGADLLGRWLAEQEISAADFAAALDIDAKVLSAWLAGRWSGAPMVVGTAAAIDAATLGAVPANSWVDSAKLAERVTKAMTTLGLGGGS